MRPAVTGSSGLKVIETQRNAFGVFRRYLAPAIPSHDPDQLLRTDSAGLSDIPANRSEAPTAENLFGPYPNQSSFMLGQWYWCGGAQKSKDDFQKLVGIIADADFSPEDIRKTRWGFIDRQLGSSGDEPLWMDEDGPIADAGWKKKAVAIDVPFRHAASAPSKGRGKGKAAEGRIQEYAIPDFYHRSVVAILREKLGNEDQFQHFHLDPFELLWQPRDGAEPVRLSGELYNSPAFIEAHREVQELPGEPGCSMPRCVVGLMFASDSTQLTAFGQAKLWPAYLFFGNDSKYRRAKPSLHLCCHVAYFQKVSRLCGLLDPFKGR